jgi:DNA ligase (NAD+)
VNTEVFTCPRRIAAYHENTAKERPSLPVDIDGLVVKDGKTDAADLRRGAPERQIAFKFRMGRLA